MYVNIYIYTYTGYVYVHGNAFKLLGEDGLKLKTRMFNNISDCRVVQEFR